MLRPYQEEDSRAVARLDAEGQRRQLGVQSTGLGKAVLLANLNKYLGRSKREITLVNREELVRQTVEKYEKYNPGLKVGVEKAGIRSRTSDDVIVASIQTLGNVAQDEDGVPIYNKRIQTLDPDEFDVVVADEGHRFVAAQAKSILKYFNVYRSDERFNDPSKLLLCLTATPNRADNKGLEEICDTIAFNRDLVWAIQNKWLTDISAWRVNTQIDISDVRISGGDFNDKELTKKINTPERNELVVRKFKEITNGGQKKAVFFVTDVAHAHDLAAELNKGGVKALAVHGGMSDTDRRLALEMHKQRHVLALVNCSLLTEGYDDPSIECVCMVRPTKSGLLYRQCIGRGLRPFPSPEDLAEMRSRGKEPKWIKEHCIVIDFVDVSARHSLITVPTLFGMSSGVDLKGKKVGATVEEFQEKIKALPAAKQTLIQMEQFDDLNKLTGVIEKIDLLAVPSTPPEVQKISELSWVGSQANYMLALPDYTTYSIKPNTLGNFDIYKITKGFSQLAGNASSLNDAIKSVERIIPDDQFQFAKVSAKWKKEPVTGQQVELLQKIDANGVYRHGSIKAYRDFISRNLDKGSASALISKIIGEKRK